MDTAAVRVIFALIFVTVVVTEAANDETAPRTRRSSYFGQPFAMPRKRSSYIEDAEEKRSTYLGFPRLGRGYLALPRMGRSSPSGHDILGFPRSSRGYLALPRMGRSSPAGSGSGSDDDDAAAAAAANGNASCCKMGLKKEWLIGEDGKMTPKSVCEDGEFCCPGFEEVQDTKPDGSFYTMCVPKCNSNGDTASDNVMLKLRQMLRN